MYYKKSKHYVKIKRNRVMNNDVLKEIFKYLSLKEKVKLERSCNQFMIYVNELLLRQKRLKIYDKNNLNLIKSYNKRCNSLFTNSWQ